MKAIIACVLLSYFTLPKFLNGQTQECFQYSAFIPCDNVITINGVCPTWADNCNEGWIRSHGSPQIITYEDTSTGTKPIFVTYAYMWSFLGGNASPVGEGMFSSYNFMVNHSYKLRFRISTDVSNGSVFFYATNGLTQSPLTDCGNPIPTNITQKQLIGQFNGSTNGTIDISFTFIPNANYSQIWIYPKATSGPQYNLGVLFAGICPSCDGVIIYNTGSVPTGETRAGTIQAGSTAGSGGSGTVTVQSSQNTSFIGINEIVLLPEFHAIVTTGTFSAIASSCQPGGRPDLDSINIQLIQSDEHYAMAPVKAAQTVGATDFDSDNFQKISVYPSISTGLVNITGNLLQLGNYRISVYDQLGKRVFLSTQNHSNNKIALNLEYLKTGLYILQIESATRKVVRKIIISR